MRPPPVTHSPVHRERAGRRAPARAAPARITALLSVLLAAAPAHAALVELTFSGHVTQILGSPHGQWSTIGLGDPFVVRCVIDSEAEDQSPGGAGGLYFYQSVSISVGPYTVTTGTGPENYISVSPFGGLGGMSSYSMKYFDAAGDWEGLVSLEGPGALPDDALPIDLDLEAFTFLREMGLHLSESVSLILAVPTSYTYRLLPAPGALALLTITALFPRRHRRLRT
ncbi:MAG: hypothetical protein KF817_10610 [Phycisphaeraceae bacterium]|nr:hypothetical protein [Phycisphaeraceae bacterium]